MTSAKRSKGGSVPSVLDYFSKTKRKKAPKSQTTPSFGTPAPAAHHPAHGIDGGETPVSVVSDDAAGSSEPFGKANVVLGRKGVSRKIVGEERGEPDSSTPASSATLDTHEPNTPPSPASGSCVPEQTVGIPVGRVNAMQTDQTLDTPPSNDTYLTSPPSPPTPADKWRNCPIDQKENKPINSERGQLCNYEDDSEIEGDVDTPRSLLEIEGAPAQTDSQRKPQNANMGTPPNARIPSAASTLPRPNDFFRNYAALKLNNPKRGQPCKYEGGSAIEGGVDTPKSLLEAEDVSAPADSQLKPPTANVDTPSAAGTPSTASTVPRSNDFFRNYAASTSSKSSERRKMDQNDFFSKPIKKQKRSSNQLFLDFGQNSFGRQTICNICGMLRVHGMEEDDAQHAKICKEYKEGVMCMGWKNERRVATFGEEDRILEVRPEDTQQHHKKVSEVKAIVDKELGFTSRRNEDLSGGPAANMTSYMCVSKKRVVGLLVAKRIRKAYKLLPSKDGEDDNTVNNSFSISRSLKSSKALLGVHQIWVHKSHRSRGIASKLVTAAR
eukprot:CAMPEP_0172531194 /NCGR_PEP_ID=MMETSP1067-20121228/4695_1 /TAXON_ID=265564 ORGANISM="Thalassiosira punctigera, Strain Tpunct2005C2" /NCGR_SAMPLE_ID=MMETSP1067 /ASSEMBLY_ACC=CAM_ASM_000444 /LENGTH=552 /DNA_ID=CAMNT_0013315549 /DNA_START=42 /DNA_END=1697 /DNA_ORIENTATION=+